MSSNRAQFKTTPKPRRLDVPREVAREFAPYFEANHRKGRFHNPWPFESRRSLKDVLAWKRNSPSRKEKRDALVEAPSFSPSALSDFDAMSRGGRLLWLGHASFFIEIDGLMMAIDPILGRIARAMPRSCPQPLGARQLPPLDVLLITHGHYDHLDRPSIAALCRAASTPPLVIVPKGLAASLPVVCRRVVELDWWEAVSYGGVEIALVPSQHWHRRALDEDRALWGGYVMRGSRTVYHSGDTGFFGGFEAIGRLFQSGIDVACLPLGAYAPRWFMGSQHMAPEESLQALIDLNARHLVGMHWGTFDLTDEPLDAGPRLLMEQVRARNFESARCHILRPGGVMGFAESEVSTRSCFELNNPLQSKR